MARPKNQAARRRQLIEAAQEAIVQRGLAGLRIKDVAAQAGMSAGSVSYYYERLEDLLVDVHRAALDRFYWRRREPLDDLSDPADRLAGTIRAGLPTGPDDLLCRVLYEMHVHAARDSLHAALMTSLFDREVSVYLAILETGAATGVFRLTAPALEIARNLVVLEDGLGLHIVGGNTTVDSEAAERLVLSYAQAATGYPAVG